MNYVFLSDGNTVAEVIPDENPDLPGFTIEQRYAPDFVSKLLPVADGVEVEQNWVYDPMANTFAPPVFDTATVERGEAVEPGNEPVEVEEEVK